LRSTAYTTKLSIALPLHMKLNFKSDYSDVYGRKLQIILLWCKPSN